MKRVHLGLAMYLALSTRALVAGAQSEAPLPPPPPVADPAASPWGAPPPPPPAGPVVYATQPVYAVQSGYTVPYAARRPTRIPYEGGPVPPGGRIEERPRLGLVIGGSVTFGVTWLLTATLGGLAASIDDGFGSSRSSSPAWWLVAPVIGPIGYALSEGVNGSAAVILGLDAIAQGAGLAMLIYGMVNRVPYVVFDGYARRTAPGPRWALLPGTSATPHGASLALTF